MAANGGKWQRMAANGGEWRRTIRGFKNGERGELPGSEYCSEDWGFPGNSAGEAYTLCGDGPVLGLGALWLYAAGPKPLFFHLSSLHGSK